MGLVSTEMTDSFIFFSSWNPCLLIYLKLDKGTSFGRSLPEKRLIGSEYPWEAIIWVALEEKACVNVSWRRLAQIKQLAWPMAERQIEHRKSCYPVVNWRSRPVAKSAYYFFNTYRPRVLEIFFLRSEKPTLTNFLSSFSYLTVFEAFEHNCLAINFGVSGF